jgi:hypothetical protein
MRLKIGEVGETEVEAIQDPGGAEVTIHHPPLGLAPGSPFSFYLSGSLVIAGRLKKKVLKLFLLM